MKKYWNGESKRNDEIASLIAFARNDGEHTACYSNQKLKTKPINNFKKLKL
jgi:hypothetical protein